MILGYRILGPCMPTTILVPRCVVWIVVALILGFLIWQVWRIAKFTEAWYSRRFENSSEAKKPILKKSESALDDQPDFR